MVQLETKALYNSLRMNWLNHPNLPVETWQVEDYRSLPLDVLLQRLEPFYIHLDQTSFIAFAQNSDTPEELTIALMRDDETDPISYDKIYLLVFELWRRLVPEKLCLTIFCDELDHQIELYDLNSLENMEKLQDALATLQNILDENVDAGGSPNKVFTTLSANCANNIENFLYDFISDRLEEENYSYARDLLEGFVAYIEDSKWFDLLKIHLQLVFGDDFALPQLKKLASKAKAENDLFFDLELLALLAKVGDRDLFLTISKQVLPLIEIEEDFQDLLIVGADFCSFIDNETIENSIQELIDGRANIDLEAPFNAKDADAERFLQLLKQV